MHNVRFDRYRPFSVTAAIQVVDQPPRKFSEDLDHNNESSQHGTPGELDVPPIDQRSALFVQGTWVTLIHKNPSPTA